METEKDRAQAIFAISAKRNLGYKDLDKHINLLQQRFVLRL